MNGLVGSGKWFDEVRVGDTFASALTVTETHIVVGGGLIGDSNPHHLNAEYAKTSRFGTPRPTPRFLSAGARADRSRPQSIAAPTVCRTVMPVGSKASRQKTLMPK